MLDPKLRQIFGDLIATHSDSSSSGGVPAFLTGLSDFARSW
jgi:hypothetical protein